MTGRLTQRLAAEALGTTFLVATVVGSGIMASSLTQDIALALLCNAVATAAMLAVLITVLGPVSGAHFNPAVSLMLAIKGDQPIREAALYALAQVAGGLVGVMAAHLMFDQAVIQASLKVRSGAAQWFSEWVATFGLAVTVLAASRFALRDAAWLIAAYIAAAYWFTASTSFANPAVALARAFTNSFSGIRFVDLPGFVVAELAGALCALALMAWLQPPPDASVKPDDRNDP